MKNLLKLDAYRLKTPAVLKVFGFYGDETCGAFEIPYPRTGVLLKTIASANSGWDHVSVSLANRCPNWAEMQHVHRTFFQEHETAWEYHVRPDKHINFIPNCLHIWRKHNFDIPLPPPGFV